MDMMHDEIDIYCLPDSACCNADDEKRSPLEIEECPIGCDICTGDCSYYEE